MINKDKIERRVLTENTAQTVLKALRAQESNKETVQERWIWELLQNARDASLGQDTKLIVSIEITDQGLVFQHNGRGFTVDEVAHIIYHGSTKVGDERTIGQYGSGFLTTHLLSPEIQISGLLDEGQPFNFRLKREIGSPEELSKSMRRAWDDFDTSQASALDSFTTRFGYPLNNGVTGIVNEGIETLRRCAPFVVAFNREFQSIEIKTNTGHTRFKVDKRLPYQDSGIERVTVIESSDTSDTKLDYIIAKGACASVAIPVKNQEGGLICLPLHNIPKLFLGFPLIGTESFSFPGVINSFLFTPTEERNGVYLAQGNDDANASNEAAIEEACKLQIKLIEFMADLRSADIFNLTCIPQIPEADWLNKSWMQSKLDDLVEEIRSTPSVINQSTTMAPQDALIPLTGSDQLESLWHLTNDIAPLATRVTSYAETSGWASAVQSWASIKSIAAASLSEGFNHEKLVKYVEHETIPTDDTYGTIRKLRSLLTEGVCAVSWLNRLYQTLIDCRFSYLIRERKIVLDQGGHLDQLTELHRDSDVDETLKEIADDYLDLRIKPYLRDTRLLPLDKEVGKGDYSNDNAIAEIITKLREFFDNTHINDDFIQASARLLNWIVTKQDWDHLRDFPACSTSSRDGRRLPLSLLSLSVDSAEMPLAPVKSWKEDLQQYADLFPWRYTLDDAYFDAMPDASAWKSLSEQQYIRLNVLMDVEDKVDDFLPDLLPDGNHKTVERVKLTDIAFLRTAGDDSIIERVRGSQRLARLFWQFLTKWLIAHDEKGLEMEKTKCECQEEHNYFKARWLVPIVNNIWVPQGQNIRDRANARSIATLLRDSEWRLPESLSHGDPFVKLLEAMNIDRFDMVREFVVTDEASRASLDDALTNIVNVTHGDLTPIANIANSPNILNATNEDLNIINDVLKDLQTDDGLEDLISKRRKQVQIVRKNQKLGEIVERLVKDSLESEGFNVQRTGIGSDLKIEYDSDSDENDDAIGLKLSRNDLSWLVEVKATRDDNVRMSTKQAETAVEEGDRFLLCVVPVDEQELDLNSESIRGNMRFVQNVGPRVKALFKGFDTLKAFRNHAIEQGVDEDIQLEIQGVLGKIRVGRKAWQDGISLSDLASKLV